MVLNQNFTGIAVGVVGLGLMAAALVQFRRAMRASRWPTVPGRIVSARLEDGPLMGRPIPVASHRAIVTYSYEVAGAERVSNRVFFDDQLFRTGDDARDRVRKYEPGSAVQVYYDPQNPSNAVLEPYTGSFDTAKWIALAAASAGAVLVAQCWTR